MNEIYDLIFYYTNYTSFIYNIINCLIILYLLYINNLYNILKNIIYLFNFDKIKTLIKIHYLE